MSWNYGGDPFNDIVDEIRFLVGDTDSTDPLIQDEELFYLLRNSYPSPKWAAAAAATAIAAKFARKVDKSVGPLSIKASQKFAQYTSMAKQLGREAAMEGVRPYAGGISVADKQLTEQDLDRIRPAVTRRLHERYDDQQFSATPPNSANPYP